MDNKIEFLGIHYDNDGEELENVDLGGVLWLNNIKYIKELSTRIEE
jgi:hypothetical protein